MNRDETKQRIYFSRTLYELSAIHCGSSNPLVFHIFQSSLNLRKLRQQIWKFFRRCVRFHNFSKTEADAAVRPGADRGEFWLALRLSNRDSEWPAALANCQRESTTCYYTKFWEKPSIQNTSNWLVNAKSQTTTNVINFEWWLIFFLYLCIYKNEFKVESISNQKI